MRRRFAISFRSCFILVLLLLSAVMFHSPTIHAAQKHIVRDSSTVIAKNQTVDDVVVFGSNAFIQGKVKDAVIVINGDTHLYSTAATDLVISIGGHFTQDQGAKVNQVFILSFNEPLRNDIALGSAITFGFWACRLAMSVVMVIFPVLLSMLLRKQIHRPLLYVEQSARRTGLVGFLATVCFLAVIAILAITIIGIPVALLLLLLYAITVLIGLSVVSIWISKITIDRDQERPLWQQSLIGSTIIMAFCNVPLIGPIILLSILCVSIGLVSIWGWGVLQGRKHKSIH
jgi:hypothetical protein